MIANKKDYLEYKRADEKSGYFEVSYWSYLFSDSWRFMRLLRRLEYLNKAKTGILWKALEIVTKFRFLKLSKKLGYSIPPHTCGQGLCLPHYGNIVINPDARVGNNCKIHIGVNIGAAYSNSEHVPLIGDGCYIAPGAKLFGNITIANNVKIGANAVVNKSCLVEGASLLGIPAKIYATHDCD